MGDDVEHALGVVGEGYLVPVAADDGEDAVQGCLIHGENRVHAQQPGCQVVQRTQRTVPLGQLLRDPWLYAPYLAHTCLRPGPDARMALPRILREHYSTSAA